MTNSVTPGTPSPAPKGGMPKWLIVLLVILVVIIVGCCGGASLCGLFVNQKVKEIEQEGFTLNTGEGSVTFGKEGVAIKTEEGTIQTGNKLPANFPKDIPAFAGLKPIASAVSSEGDVNASLTGKGDKAEIVAFYKEQMVKEGWTETKASETENTAGLVYEKDDFQAEIMITSVPGDDQVIVLLARKKKDAE